MLRMPGPWWLTSTIDFKLQDTFDKSQWFDKKTTTTITDNVATIKLDTNIAGDQTHLPLRTRGRIVVTTGAGEGVTVTKVLKPERRHCN